MCKVREVKAQPLRRIERPRLLYMCAKNIPQRRIHKMRSCVVADNPRPPLRIRYNRHAIPDALAILQLSQVKSVPIDVHSLEPRRLFDHVFSKAESVVEPKGGIA